ncbi:MarR family transcriptional regulator [Aquamicrobium terrae]|uniref:MarR family transcriptional regulator for hemolysin n=1 Tax=Aquamicrobium terrae TaxID=1324945 RepID=A0ABV2MVK1_9HYPH
MDAGEQFAVELSRVSRLWRKRIDERLRHLDLTQARWMVLLQLSRAAPVSQRELADTIGVEGPTLVRVLDNLERQGLVLRRACPGDRRVKLVELAEGAGPVLAEISRIAAGLRRELLEDVAAEELGRARELLKIIGDRLESGTGG